LRRLKAKVRYEPIGFELLPEKFTLGELQRLYETVLETAIDKRNFRKKILGMELIDALDEYQRDVAHRAAQYYRFNRPRYEQLKNRGSIFKICPPHPPNPNPPATMFGIRYIKVPPTTYLLQFQRGHLVREGVGQAFFYYEPTTSLVAIPTASSEVPFIFE